MINKIIKIKGVGKFKNVTSKGDISFAKSNIIYAENGFGKTTFTSILNSFSSNVPELIIKRKTIGVSEQEVEILFDNKKYRFFNNEWIDIKENNNIEIFDTFFINDNIFSGFDFSPEHRKNLYKFIFGIESINLNNEISEIKIQIENQNKELKNTEEEIKARIETITRRHTEPNDFNNFLRLKIDEKIDEKIEYKQKSFEISIQNKEIAEKGNLKKISNSKVSIDINSLKNTLENSIATISKSYIEIVESQIQEINQNIPNSKEWIKNGSRYLSETNNSTCPFCKQSVADNTLIDAYTNYFNESYKIIASSLQSYKKDFTDFVQNLKNTKPELIETNNKYSLEFWNKYFASSKELVPSNDNHKLLKIVEDIIQIIQQKIDNLLLPIQTEKIDSFFKRFSEHNEQIEKYNTCIDDINANISIIKKQIKPANEIENELINLKLIKLRHSPEMVKVCNSYKTLWIAQNDNKQNKATKQKQLYDFSTKLISNFGDEINSYLKLFNSPYRIKKIKSGFVSTSKQASLNYEIQFNGHSLSFKEQANKISIKYTLSEGDKSTLAFAFFLAKLDIKQNFENKILVIDDPLSSFDKNRRNRTIEILSELSQKVSQLIILTHNINFYFDLFTNTQIAPKAFKIDYSANIIEYENIKQDMENPYFKWIKEIEAFIENPVEDKIEYIEAQIRRIIEDTLKYRFFHILYKEQKKSDGTTIEPYSDKKGLGTMIEILENSNVLFKADSNTVIMTLKNLNSFSNKSHHGIGDKNHRIEKISITELVSILKELLELIFEKI